MGSCSSCQSHATVSWRFHSFHLALPSFSPLTLLTYSSTLPTSCATTSGTPPFPSSNPFLSTTPDTSTIWSCSTENRSLSMAIVALTDCSTPRCCHRLTREPGPAWERR